MTFPDTPRVIYNKNPLNQVICQLRFPPILKIEEALPSGFQDRIRHEYPLFVDKQPDEAGIELPPEIAKAVGSMGIGFPFQSGKRSFEFSSIDQVWKVSLTRDFLALATTDYKTWQDFHRHLQTPLEALLSEYDPNSYVRIGLRYRDVIDKDELGLKEVPWKSLLQPHIAGELATDIEEQFIKKLATDFLVELKDSIGHVRIRHGLAENKSAQRNVYVIDADFYTDELTEKNHVIDKLNKFNREAGHLFRWCITEQLHSAMEPRTP